MFISKVQETKHFASAGIEADRAYHAIRSTDLYAILWLAATHHHIHIDHPAVYLGINDTERSLERDEPPKLPFLQHPVLRPFDVVTLLAGAAVVVANAIVVVTVIVANTIVVVAVIVANTIVVAAVIVTNAIVVVAVIVTNAIVVVAVIVTDAIVVVAVIVTNTIVVVAVVLAAAVILSTRPHAIPGEQKARMRRQDQAGELGEQGAAVERQRQIPRVSRRIMGRSETSVNRPCKHREGCKVPSGGFELGACRLSV
jgi:hypothetical protein